MCVSYRAAAPTTIAFSIVNQWFRDLEGIATGCVTVGAALGGIFFSLVLQALFARFIWRNAMLVLAGIMAALMLFGSLLVETNVKKGPATIKGSGLNTDGLKRLSRSVKFWLAAYAVFGESLPAKRTVWTVLRWAGERLSNTQEPLRSAAYELVLFIQWGSIPTYAVSVGMGSNQFYLMMSYNV